MTPVDLRAEFGDRFKIGRDPAAMVPGQSAEDRAWLWTIPCADRKHVAHIFSNGNRDGSAALGYFGTSSQVKAQLASMGVGELHCDCDGEYTFVFPLASFDSVAEIVKAKRIRRLTDAHRAALSQSNRAFRFGASN